MNSKRSQLFKIFIIALVFISLGYAALTTFVKIDSHVGLGTTIFAVHFDNISVLSNTATVTEDAHYVDDSTKKGITFDIYLAKVGYLYSFSTDIVNESTLPAKIQSIELTNLNDSQKKLVQYKLYYTKNKKEVSIGDYIGPESSKNITFEILYKLSSDVEESDLVTSNLSLNPILTINYENGDIDEYNNTQSFNGRLQQIDNKRSSSLLNFGTPVSSSEFEGLYVLEDTRNDTYPILFYRGGHQNTNNHVLFANYCWRILRTTNTGGIKIIYNGVPTNGICNNSTTRMGNALLGTYMYDGSNRLYSGSAVSTYLESWYYEKLMAYNDYIEDTQFCNDNTYSNGNVSVECSTENIDSVANGKLTYPIGMITAQEANMGGITSSGSTSYSWIYTGESYWTMSLSNLDSRYVWHIVNSGSLNGLGGVSGTIGVRPVISISNDVPLTSGDGTSNNPYVVG